MTGQVHKSNPARLASVTGPASVALDFCGLFVSGSRRGELFAGRIAYCRDAAPSECHWGFAQFDDWPGSIATLVIDGQCLTATSATVYQSVPDGRGGFHDLVTLATSQAAPPTGEFELMFAASQAGALDATRMPSAEELAAMPIKRLIFSTESGVAPSEGELLLGPGTNS